MTQRCLSEPLLTGVKDSTPRSAAHRLHSYSSHGENRTALSFPQGEQVRLTVDNANQPLPCSTALDIKGFFDNLDHDLMMRASRKPSRSPSTFAEHVPLHPTPTSS